MSDSSHSNQPLSVEIIEGPIDVENALSRFHGACLSRSGATLQFTGRVREESSTTLGSLTSLDYHAYHQMASQILRQIAAQSVGEFGLDSCLLWHSVGVVPVGGAAFVVCVSAPHRAEAVEGLCRIIDRTKREAPIWKREIWTDGERWKSPAIDQPEGAHA